MTDTFRVIFTSAVDFTCFLTLIATKLKDTETEDDVMEAFKVFDKDGQGKPWFEPYLALRF